MSFEEYGQNETLISSIRNIIKDYPAESVFKEFLQNADDAGATRFHIIIDRRSHPTKSLFNSKMEAWQGPAILIYNDAKFKETDFKSLMQIRVGGKQEDNTKIGKYGLGFNSCYHFTDVPSFISGDKIAFLDPQEKYLSKRGVIGPIPRNGIRGRDQSTKDQLAPFEGIEGINFRSTFEGTLFRLPLRKIPSGISESIFTIDEILELIETIKLNFSSQFLFLRNIEKLEMSCISEGILGMFQHQTKSLWKADIKGLDENTRNKRKCIKDITQNFQLKIETDNLSNKQTEHWIIVTGSQQNPEDDQLRKYAKRHHLCVKGGIAALLKSEADNDENFKGIMYSFLSLPDVTHLPVHLNGTWAQSSDRGRLLIEKDDFPDVDNLKIDWNRHILLDFLPKLHCKLLKEVTRLRIDFNDHAISKFWPFPPATRNYPKYAIEYGFNVLQEILDDDDIFLIINDGSYNETNNREDILFNLLPRRQALELRDLIRNNWDEISSKIRLSRIQNQPGWAYHVNTNNRELVQLRQQVEVKGLKSLIRSLPIWPELSDPLEQDSQPPLRSASCGYILPKNIKHYQTKRSRVYLKVSDDLERRIFTNLDVSTRDFSSYISEDVEFPSKCNYYYLNFLKGVLECHNATFFLRDLRCFPAFTDKLKHINELYDYGHIVFRTVFGESRSMFLRQDFSEYTEVLSSIGFKNEINEETFIECIEKVDDLQRRSNPPFDIRYRGFILVDHFYKNIDLVSLGSIKKFPFVPVSKNLDKPYSLNLVNYDCPRVLDCFDNIILPKYKEVAWSRMSLIADDVVPPEKVLEKFPSLGKPKAVDVIEHLRYLYKTIRTDEEWKNNWVGMFKHNVYEVYNWLNEECSDDEDLSLLEYISNEPLFLNLVENQDPFDRKNWVSAENLVLNTESNEVNYVNIDLARYPAMLKSAGAGEVKRPNVKINVRHHDQSCINISSMVSFLKLNDEFPLNDVTFIVNGEKAIKASRYVLSASSESFREKIASAGSGPIHIRGIKPGSMRVLLCYLYAQNIDIAIQNLSDSDSDNESDNISYVEMEHESFRKDFIATYKDLLKLANDYKLCHLKESMELRLSQLVTVSNVRVIQGIAESSKASQLKKYCDSFILDNHSIFEYSRECW